MSDIYKEHAELYRQADYWPRPITPGHKKCPVTGWQRPDHEHTAAELSSWPEKYGHFGIGLLMGSPLPDGTLLGAVDIDRDDYIRVAKELLEYPPCGRVGQKGLVLFVRIRGDGKYRKFQIKQKDEPAIHVGDLLCTTRLCVLPPTIHPNTNAPYSWVGKPLLETDFTELPIVEE